MKTLQIAYKCGFCRRLYQRRAACIRHEQHCPKNPDIRPLCYDCKHFDGGKNKSGLTTEEVRYAIYFPSGASRTLSKTFDAHICAIDGHKLFNGMHLDNIDMLDGLAESGFEKMPHKGECKDFEPVF